MLDTLIKIQQNKKKGADVSTSKDISYHSLPPIKESQLLDLLKKADYVPSDYQEFLRYQNGWRDVWHNFHFIGADMPNFEDVEAFIHEVMLESSKMAEKLFNLNVEDEKIIRNWEVKTVQYYLPNYFIFAGDLSSKVILFNQYNRNDEGKEEIVIWDKYEGAVDSYPSFNNFLEHIAND